METTEIISILANLAESEGLLVESSVNNERENPQGRATPNYFIPQASFFSNAGHAGSASSGIMWSAFSGLASRAWSYVTGNYGVAVRVQLLPVNDMLLRLRDPHRERLADRMRRIMNEHSVVDLNALADTIQRDSSLVRKIILKYLVEYLIEEMSLPVRIPAADGSLQDPGSY